MEYELHPALPLPGPGELFIIRDIRWDDTPDNVTPIRYGRAKTNCDPVDKAHACIWYRDAYVDGSSSASYWGLPIDSYMKDKERAWHS